MKLRELLSSNLSKIEKVSFHTDIFIEFLKNKATSLDSLYPYIFEYHSLHYKKQLKSISNRSFHFESVKTNNYYYEFKGFSQKGYAIIEAKDKKGIIKTFHINEDLSNNYFYPTTNGIPDCRFHFDEQENAVISFIEIDDAYIAIDTSLAYAIKEYTKSVKVRGGKRANKTFKKKVKKKFIEIVIQVKEKTDFKYIKSLEFINDEIKLFTTSKEFQDLFLDSFVSKVAFKRKEKNKLSTSAIYVDRGNEFSTLSKKERENYIESESIGVNIINPFVFTIHDIDLFELNYGF